MGRPTGCHSRSGVHKGEHLLGHHELVLGQRSTPHGDLTQPEADDGLRLHGEQGGVTGKLEPWDEHEGLFFVPGAGPTPQPLSGSTGSIPGRAFDQHLLTMRLP